MIGIGNDHKLYYNSATAAAPTWVLIAMVGDVSVDLTISEAEVDLRISDFVLGLPAKLAGGLNMALASDIGGTVHDALRGFALARTQKQYAAANALITTSGTQYFKGFMFFTAFPWNQATQEMANRDCTLKLGYFEESSAYVPPAWVTVV